MAAGTRSEVYGQRRCEKIYPYSNDYFEDVAKYGVNKGVLINSNILKRRALTISDLKTEEDVLAALKKVQDMKLTVNGQPVIPLQIHGKNYHGETLQFLQRSFGAMPIDKDGKFRNILLASEHKQAIQFLFKRHKAVTSMPVR